MKTTRLATLGLTASFFTSIALVVACSPAVETLPGNADCGCGGPDGGGPPVSLSFALTLPHEGFVAKVATVSDGVVLATGAPNDTTPLFLEHRDNGGAVLWSTEIDRVGSTTVYALAADSATHDTTALIAYGGDLTIGSKSLSRTGNEGGYAVVRLAGKDGKVRWLTPLNTSSAAVATFTEALALTKNGDVALCGSAGVAQTWGGQTVNDGFALVLSATDGAPKSSITFARKGTTFYPPYPSSIAVDGADQVWVTGRFSETAAFGAKELTASGKNDGFIVRLASDLSVTDATPITTSGDDAVTSIVADRNGHVFVRGSLGANGNVGGAELAAGVWIASFDEKGAHRWSKPASNFGTGVPALSIAGENGLDLAFDAGRGVRLDVGGAIAKTYDAVVGMSVTTAAGGISGRWVGGYVDADASVFGSKLKGPAPVLAYVN